MCNVNKKNKLSSNFSTISLVPLISVIKRGLDSNLVRLDFVNTLFSTSNFTFCFAAYLDKYFKEKINLSKLSDLSYSFLSLIFLPNSFTLGSIRNPA